MKSLQHHEQDVKKVVASEGLEDLHGQHQGGVDDPVRKQIVSLSVPVLCYVVTQFRGKTYLLGKITSRVTRKTTANATNSASHVFFQPAP